MYDYKTTRLLAKAVSTLTVLAVLVEKGRHNRDFQPIVDSIPNGREHDLMSVDLADLPPLTLPIQIAWTR